MTNEGVKKNATVTANLFHPGHYQAKNFYIGYRYMIHIRIIFHHQEGLVNNDLNMDHFEFKFLKGKLGLMSRLFRFT
jgi:hypothetical protein